MRNLVAVVITIAVAACGGGDEMSPVTVRVIKSLGSAQCTGGGTTVAVLLAQLSGAGVQVTATSCGNDGLLYPAVCGAPDGALGIFVIPTSQQIQADALGFMPMSSVPTAIVSACR